MSDATKPNDGGPAFPQMPVITDGRLDWPGSYGLGGLSLRDFYAAEPTDDELAAEDAWRAERDEKDDHWMEVLDGD